MAAVTSAPPVVSTVPTHVFLFDLDEDVDEILSSKISELQIERAPEVSQGTFDGSRILCVGSIDGLGKTIAAIEKIMLAPSVEKTICLLSGRPTENAEHGGPQLDLPAQLLSAGCVAIWVGDPRGVVWAVGYGKAKKLAVYKSDPDGKGAFLTLQESLRLPELFDEVFERGQSASSVLSPALKVVVPGISDPRLLAAASSSALGTLTGDPSEAALTLDLPEGLANHPELMGQASPPTDLFTADGQIGTLAADVERARREAVELSTTRLVKQPTRALVEADEQAVRTVGEKLKDLRKTLVSLFESIEASDGLDYNEQRALKRAGIIESVLNLHMQQGKGGSEQEEAVREFALAEISDQRTLAQVAGELRHLVGRATPRTSEQTKALLEAACPEERVQQLLAEHPLRLQLGRPLALLTIAIASAMLWPSFSILIAFMLLIICGVYLASLTVKPLPRIRTWLQLGAKSVHSAPFWWTVGSVFVGLAIGGVLLGTVQSVGLEIGGIVVFLLAIIGFLRLTWKKSVDCWLEETGLLSVEKTLGDVMSALSDVAVNDWLLSNERTHFAMTVSRLAEAVEKMRGTMTAALEEMRSQGLERTRESYILACNPAIRADLSAEGIGELYQHSSVIEGIVLSDHLDALTRSIEAEWPLLTAKAGDSASDEINNRLSRWLGAYRKSIIERGLFSNDEADIEDLSPEGRARRADLLEDLWRGLDLATVLGDLSELVQYCAAEDLPLLDQGSGYQVIRFVPAQRSSETDVERPVRTASMLMAGALRLVELRTGSVTAV